MMGRKVRMSVLYGVLLAALAGGCRETEQGRALHLEKGVYQGPSDTPLDQGRVETLRERNQMQRF